MDEQTFVDTVGKHYDYFVRLATSHGAWNPRDVVQHIVMRLLDNKKYETAKHENVRAWVARVVINRVKNERIQAARRTAILNEGNEMEFSQHVGTEVRLLELTQDVRAAITTMEPLDQQIATAIYMGNETFDSLGELLDFAPSYLRKRAMAVKRHLRDFLKEYSKIEVEELPA